MQPSRYPSRLLPGAALSLAVFIVLGCAEPAPDEPLGDSSALVLAGSPRLDAPIPDERPGLSASSALPLPTTDTTEAPFVLTVKLGSQVDSLAAAERYLRANPPVQRQIHVVFPSKAVFREPTTHWSYHPAGKVIRFMPDGWDGYLGATAEAIAASCPKDADKPRFDGHTKYNASGTWFYSKFPMAESTAVNLEFYCLAINGYAAGGISISPYAVDPVSAKAVVEPTRALTGIHATNIRVIGNLFSNLGNLWAEDKNDCGLAGVQLWHAGGAVVAANRFVNLVGVDSPKPDSGDRKCNPGTMHAVYLKYQSVDSMVVSNTVVRVSGDPFRVAYGSDRNVFRNNKIERAGSSAVISDYMQRGDYAEWWSSSNRLEDFRETKGFLGEPLVPTYCFDVASCPARGGAPRFIVPR